MEALAVRWLTPGQVVSVETTCLDCGESIRIRMRDEDVEVDPPTTVGYQVSPFVQWREGSSAFN